MPDRHGRRRSVARGPGGLAIASLALAVFLALMVVLATQLRDNPGAVQRLASRRPHVVVVRRVYQTVIRERVVSAAVPAGAGGTTVSSSGASYSGSAPVAAAPTTRTS